MFLLSMHVRCISQCVCVCVCVRARAVGACVIGLYVRCIIYNLCVCIYTDVLVFMCVFSLCIYKYIHVVSVVLLEHHTISRK